MLTNSQELIGQTLGTCTLKRLLGRGGMGAVYLAQQSRPRRTVAVKVLLPNLVEDHPREDFLVRFRREADAVAALDHIHIMPIYEYGEQAEIAYLVMPHIIGGTLRDRLQQRSIPLLEETVQIIEQAATGLDSAHAQGIVHRDLKPANILFHADGRVVLADFGLAKVMKEASEDSGVAALTNTGTIIGTPEYLSPEQGSGEPLDYRTDVYSLGVVLFQMLAGRVPFVGTSPVAIAIKHTLEMPPPITRFNPQIPPRVEAVVMKALAKNPDERFISAGEFARALRQAAESAQPVQSWPSAMVLPSQSQPEPFPPVQNHLAAGAVVQTYNANQGQDKKTPETPRIPSAQDRITALPTMMMPPPGNAKQQFHGSLTEAAPRVNPTNHLQGNTPLQPVAQQRPDATTMDVAHGSHQPTPLQQGRQEPIMEKRVLANHHRTYAPPTENPQVQIRSYQQAPNFGQQNGGSRRMLFLLASVVIVLVVIVGSIFIFQQEDPENTNPNQAATATSIANGNTDTPEPGTTPTQEVVATPTPLTASDLPDVPLAHGALVYGTLQPSCDGQGTWTIVNGGEGACTDDGLRITSNGQRSSVFLENGDLPSNFILQVQVTIHPGSQGSFGIYYHSQLDDYKQAFIFMIDPGGSWTAYSWDNGGYQPLNQNPVSIGPEIKGTLTIALSVSGTSYNYYVNGAHQGLAVSGPQHPDGTIGFAVDPGADITFKNLGVYTN